MAHNTCNVKKLCYNCFVGGYYTKDTVIIKLNNVEVNIDEKISKIYPLGISLAYLIKKMNKDNNILHNEELLRDVIKHNKYRYYLLDNTTIDELPEDYTGLKYDIESIIKSKIALSCSTNKIRQDIFHEEFPNHTKYYFSKLRYDKLNGYRNKFKVYNCIHSLFNYFHTYDVYHYIIAPYHNTIFNMTSLNFTTLKAMNRNISYTKRLNSVIGYIIKYELSWSFYNSKLCINPHCHILYFIEKEQSRDVMYSIDEYYKSYYDNTKDTLFKLVDDDEQSINNICNYISKDPFNTIFKADTPIKPKYIDIIAQLAQVKNLHFNNSYKEFKNLFKTE